MRATITAALDGTVYTWSSPGGVARTYDELIPRMCELDAGLAFEVFADSEPLRAVPLSDSVRLRRCTQMQQYLRPHRLFDRFRDSARSLSFALAMRGSSCDLWRATYFSVPQRCSVPVVVSNYDMIYFRYPDLYSRATVDETFRRRQLRALRRADHVIVNSETTKADTVRFASVAPERITAIPLASSAAFRRLPVDGADLSASPLADLVAERRPFILYVGSRHPHKNFAGLATAFAQWRQDDFLLVVAGPALEDRERVHLARLGVLERVRAFTGLSDDQLALLYNMAGVFVYPSLYEGFGVPLVEAMACACPVVASRIPSSLEVADGVAEFFDLQDETTLVAALEQAVTRGREPSWAHAAVARAASFSWGECARRTLEVYRRVAS